jgi:hypothetical protein
MGYVSATLDLVLAMLSNITAFRTFVGAADGTAALARIVKMDSEPLTQTANYAKVGIAMDPDDELGLGIIRRNGEIGVGLWRIDLSGDTPKTRAEALLDIADAVRTGLYAARGSAGALASFTVDIGDPVHYDPTTANKGKSMIPLTIRFRG